MVERRLPTLIDFSYGARIANAFRSLTLQHSRSKRWGVDDTPMLAAIVSKEARKVNYDLLGWSRIESLPRESDFLANRIAPSKDRKFRASLGGSSSSSSWLSWFRTRSLNGRSMSFKETWSQKLHESTTKKKATITAKHRKKKFSWLPDPENRWPQGW
eukprot:c27400_g1_i1 orf=739-1212(+)